MRNLRLILAYDGTHYLGWQKTKMGPSIEETLEKAFERVLQHPIHLQGASRTDAGVHAKGQVANFFTSHHIPLDKLQHSINCLLPKDIALLSIDEAPETFHPTLEATSKEYHYDVCYGVVQLPQQRLYAWHYPYSLDIKAMREAIPLLLGNRDFAAFCNTKKNSSYSHYVRHLESIEIEKKPYHNLRFIVKGNHFLYKMVRNLVGTLVYVGCGKIALNTISDIVADRDRKQAGMTAPACGLILYQVNYTQKNTF